MNLVTDGFPALALAVDPKAPDLMRRPPRRSDDRLFDRTRFLSIGGEGLMLALIALGAFSASLFLWHQSVEQARTVSFTVMVIAQLVHAFNSRSDHLSLFQLGMITNRSLVWAFLLSLGVQLAVLTSPRRSADFQSRPLTSRGLGTPGFLRVTAFRRDGSGEMVEARAGVRSPQSKHKRPSVSKYDADVRTDSPRLFRILLLRIASKAFGGVGRFGRYSFRQSCPFP
jgi:magnesium-transporting ATPase (P-type)